MHEFRLAIYPHEGDWADARCPREALQIGAPLLTAQFGRNKKGTLPRIKGLLACSNEHIEISAIKKAEKGNDLILRLYNPGQKTQKAAICFDVPIKRCHEAGMDEGKIKEGKISDNTLNFSIGRKKIKTFLLEL
jgi:alpha-mannosidase